MPLGSSMHISASGLTAERLRLDVISNNIANVNTPNFRRQEVVFAPRNGSGNSFAARLSAARMGSLSGEGAGNGVQVSSIHPDMDHPFKVVHDPSNPAADAKGNVNMPNVEPIIEMVDMMAATRAYEGGVTAINAAKQMQQRALEIGK